MATLPVPGVPLGQSELPAVLRRIPVTLCYLFALLLGDVIMALLSDPKRVAVAGAASTNLTHLATDPLLVMPASAFVDFNNGWAWLPTALIVLGGLEYRLGARRTIMIAFGAHTLATLVSEGVVLVRVLSHVLPRTELNALDVGPSYLILGALSGCLVVGGWGLRLAAAALGVGLVPPLLQGLTSLDMSAVGHASALLLGALIAAAVMLRRRRPAPAAVFGAARPRRSLARASAVAGRYRPPTCQPPDAASAAG